MSPWKVVVGKISEIVGTDEVKRSRLHSEMLHFCGYAGEHPNMLTWWYEQIADPNANENKDSSGKKWDLRKELFIIADEVLLEK